MFANESRTKMMTICPQCGSKFSESIQFCDKCGYNLEKEKVLKEQKQTAPSNSHSPLNFKLQGQLQIISVIEIAFGIAGLVIGIMLSMLAPFIPDLIKSSPSENMVYTTGMLQFFQGLALFVGVFTLLFSALIIFFGYKLYKLENIGRFGTMIVACFALLMIPFGTVFGALTLYLLTKPDIMEIFKDRNKYF